MVEAFLISSTAEFTAEPEYVDAGYGVRGVDFVQAAPPRTTVRLEIEIHGLVGRETVERMAQAALDAAKAQ